MRITEDIGAFLILWLAAALAAGLYVGPWLRRRADRDSEERQP